MTGAVILSQGICDDCGDQDPEKTQKCQRILVSSQFPVPIRDHWLAGQKKLRPIIQRWFSPYY